MTKNIYFMQTTYFYKLDFPIFKHLALNTMLLVNNKGILFNYAGAHKQLLVKIH